MKKTFSILTLSVLLVIFTTNVFGGRGSVKQSSRAVEFKVYAASDYGYKAYEEAIASVHLNVYKICNRKKELVWTKTLDAKQLSKYPTVKDAIMVTVHIPEVCEGVDVIEASYSITYNAKGSILQTESTEFPLDHPGKGIIPVLV